MNACDSQIRILNYCRVAVRFDKKNGMIAIDQIRTIDKARILSSLGQLSTKQIEACKAVLKETFVD